MNGMNDIGQIAAAEAAASGESVVWCGQPDPYRFIVQSLPLFIFGIPWTAFAVFWVYAASGFTFPPDFSEGGFAFFPLFGLPFVLVGFGLLLSPAFQYVKAFKTLYIVTNRSARIVTLGRTKRVETFSGADLQQLQRKEKPDGSGDIIFQHRISYSSKGGRTVSPIGFFGVANVAIVEQHLASLRSSSGVPS